MASDVIAEGACTPRSIVLAYLGVTVVFTLASSLIWAINTLFLMDAGLTLFEVFLANTAFVVGQILFEIPTGVVADTWGRRVSLLLGFATLTVSTALYVLSANMRWGLTGFVVASILLGLGFCFQTGALEAWLVDALDSCGWDGPKDKVFAWGGQAFSAGMLVGTLLGGVLGQFDLAWPYYVRTVLLVAGFTVTALLVRDHGFTARPLRVSAFGAEATAVLRTGVRYGWRNPVVRPLLYTSLLSGVFLLFGFYSWQRYALDLLGMELVWLLGVVQAVSSLASIGGNALVGRVMRTGRARRDPATVLAVFALAQAVLILGAGIVGLAGFGPGWLPFALATAAYVAWNLVTGIDMPIRRAFINEQIPSEQRATVLSLDYFFADVGGAVGQPALGYISQRFSIPVGWIVGSLMLAAMGPQYARAGSALDEMRTTGADTTADET